MSESRDQRSAPPASIEMRIGQQVSQLMNPRLASLWCSRPQAAARAAPYRVVWVTVATTRFVSGN
jgi:hypothetical protein